MKVVRKSMKKNTDDMTRKPVKFISSLSPPISSFDGLR
jgi:hypothetical protein